MKPRNDAAIRERYSELDNPCKTNVKAINTHQNKRLPQVAIYSALENCEYRLVLVGTANIEENIKNKRKITKQKEL